MKTLKDALEFEWDEGNKGKNLKTHGVTDGESEEVFFDSEKKIFKDVLHSGAEERHILLGQTKQKKILFVAFTKRKNKIRIISSRPINKKEKHLYEKN
jgi:uncharacterized DUF497 family protein